MIQRECTVGVCEMKRCSVFVRRGPSSFQKDIAAKHPHLGLAGLIPSRTAPHTLQYTKRSMRIRRRLQYSRPKVMQECAIQDKRGPTNHLTALMHVIQYRGTWSTDLTGVQTHTVHINPFNITYAPHGCFHLALRSSHRSVASLLAILQ